MSFNSITILKSFQNFHIILHRGELCSIFLLKSVLASQDISQGVSHPEKVHMVFTWTSHTFHRVAPSSAFMLRFTLYLSAIFQVQAPGALIFEGAI